MTASRKQEPQSCSRKEMKSVNGVNEHGSRFFPEPPDKSLPWLIP